LTWQRLLWLVTTLLALLLIGLPAQAQLDRTLVLSNARVQLAVGTGPPETRDVTLPYHWDRKHGGKAGAALFELSFALDPPYSETSALYLPRIGNAYAIWLNGHQLQHKGSLHDANGADFAKAPRFVEFPSTLLQRENLIRVQIRADVGRRGGMGAITLGSESLVRPIYESDHSWRITGSSVVVVANLLMALIALALWLTQVERMSDGRARRNRLYLFAGLAELSWSLRVADSLVENPPISWPWWGMLTIVALTTWVCSMMLFCVEVASWRARRGHAGYNTGSWC